MKIKLHVLMYLALINCAFIYGQTPEINCRSKEATDAFFQSNPDAFQEYQNFNEYTRDFVENIDQNRAQLQTTYTIPVVFHVYGTVQNGDPVNFNTIVNSLNQVNEEFQGLNADYNTVDPNFLGIRSTMDISFKLAQIDPNGNPTDGVIFHPVASGHGNYSSPVVAADGWDNYKYMNIYITADLYGDGVSNNSGVAWYPNTTMSDLDIARVVYNGQYLTGNTSNEFASVLTHEFGHWLNLIHTHEGGCSNADQVADTPAENVGGDCNETFDCGNNINYENYMGYNGAAGCYKMFTVGQVNRMLAALNHPARQPLWQESNLNATGVNDTVDVSCNTTVSNFPYDQGFENTLGNWTQDAGNDFDWALRTGGTPSNSTGPSGAFEGTHYIYVEASDPNFGGKTTILNSPCFDLSGVNAPSANFHYQMTGNSVGTIRLEARADGETTWTEIWSQSGDQGAAWIEANVDLTGYSGNTVQLRLRGTTNTSWQGDIAIDAFGIARAQAGDTEAPSVPTNLAVTGVTTSSVALSWTASTDNVGVTGYDIFRGTTNVGTVTGITYQDTGLAEGTTYQYSIRATDAAGNVSANSNTISATTDTTAPPGGCVSGENAPYSESFEANIGLWSQGSGDDLNWTRNSGGTPSNNTGPSSGSDGAFYMYVEASGNNTGFPNKRAILNSPCFDLSNETEASFIFDYHMFGSTDGGRIDLEVSDDNGVSWISIWNQTGTQGNQWNTVTIDLASYIGTSVQLRFNRVTGGTWQSDVAIDNTRLTAGGGTDPNPPSGYCASNATSSNDEYISRVQIGSIDNTSVGGTNGYQDFTNLSTNLNGSASITITPQWRTTVYNEAYAVFIDWNRDGDFGDAGETAFSQAPTQATPITGTITVPAGASQGPTRMRVSMKYNAAPTSCENFQYGEVEDYIVNVTTSASGPSEVLQNSIYDFSIFPNPVAGGQLHLVGVQEAERYTIYNVLGQVIQTDVYTNTVNVSTLKTGVYIIEVQIGNKRLHKRFIKKE